MNTASDKPESKKEDSVHKGHRLRLKKRFRTEGIDSFEVHNVLELLLFFGVPKGDVNPLAHRLIREFGSISAVIDAPYEELLKVKGVGENVATLIKLVPAVNRRYLMDKMRDEQIIASTAQAGEYLLPFFQGYTVEIVVLLCLDAKGKVLGCEKLFEGELNSAQINIRRIVSTALKYNATAVILAHNHTSGIALPSPDDIDTTRKIRKALSSVEVRLADHIVVTYDDDFVSMSDSNMMSD